MDDGVLLQGVKYTDIDYDVFTDGADHVANGRSPFMRHTYRYTPFMAWILSFASSSSSSLSYLNWWRHTKYFGKLLFCIADALCGFIILKLKQSSRDQSQRKQNEEEESERKNINNDKNSNTTTMLKLQDALWWLYNPLPINICTRGSGESFVVLLPVLFTLITVMSSSIHTSRIRILMTAILAGMIHGLAVHAKLYPIIYTVSFMAYLSLQEQSLLMRQKGQNGVIGWCQKMQPLNVENKTATATTTTTNESDQAQECRKYPFPWVNPNRLYHLVKIWIHRLLLTPSSMLFLTFFLSTFGILTYLAVYYYGEESLQEGLLYHFSRVDHRHNYSMFWYWIYLARGRVSRLGLDMSSSSLSTMGKGLLLPQVVLLLYSSLGIAPYDLSFALFIQTFSFVAQNKVMTAQYFTWYLVLLPLCSDRIRWRSSSMIIALGLLGLSIVTWLGCAFCLEMKGMAFHLQVWMASVGFFSANVNLLRVILSSYRGFRGAIDQTIQYQAKKIQ
jgi:phosphatidylinositol glycan class M